MRLVGYVDGVEITFDFTPPNTFKAVIPKQLDGTYIVQLHAIDDAGNITNYFNVFVIIDMQKMRFKVLPKNYPFIQNGETMGYKKLNHQIGAIQIQNNYSSEAIASRYSYRELVG